MAKINPYFSDIKQNYLFAEIAKRVSTFAAEHPEKSIIKMGIGDVTLPLPAVTIEALKKGAEDLSKKETFKGYPDYEGYDFVRNAISDYYKENGADVSADEIFVSDGAKSDCGNIGDIFAQDNTVLVTDPVYPVYVDTNLMSGRKIIYADSNEANGFAAMPDKNVKADIIYLCSPNNPTGSAYNKEQLKAWVDYAIQNDAVIIYDSAYEAFITEDLPRSIYCIEGAKKCAIEICSLSKTAGFTGTRCGYTVVPKELEREGVSLYKLWYRRQATKFNGVSWPVQCAAAAVFTKEGRRQVEENLSYYRANAKIIADTMDELGIFYTGGKNSPYVWLKCPGAMSSWEFFDYLLENIGVVGTPGEGFGKNGEGFFRLTAFSSRENTVEAMRRLKELLTK